MNLHYSTLKLDSIGKEGTSQLNQMCDELEQDKLIGIEELDRRLGIGVYAGNATLEFESKGLNLENWIVQYSKRYPEVLIVLKTREEINDIRYLWFVNKGEILALRRSEDSYRLDD